jgi:hypothetical protein
MVSLLSLCVRNRRPKDNPAIGQKTPVSELFMPVSGSHFFAERPFIHKKGLFTGA